MVGWFHSIRAKLGTGRQVNGWIKKIEKGIRNRQDEIVYFEKIAPLTPSDWDDNMIPILEKELVLHKEKLRYYVLLKKRYQKDGLI